MSLTLGIRLHRKSSIFRRVEDLIKSGVLDYEKRPLWYDVYKAHPPLREPVYKYEPSPDMVGLPDEQDDVREIFYPEDWARSVAYSKFKITGSCELDPRSDLRVRQRRTNHIQKFVEAYKQMEKREPELSKTELFIKAEEELAPVFNELFKRATKNRLDFEESQQSEVDLEKDLISEKEEISTESTT